MSQFHWDPDRYLELMHTEISVYEEFQDVAAKATGTGAGAVLELGTGTGETSRRVLEQHPGCELTGIDASPNMLAHARERLPRDRVRLDLGRLQDPLPDGTFDVVVSALTIHHLDADAKADLFGRVAATLRPRGRFVLADVVVPDDPRQATIPLDPAYDLPSTLAEQQGWLDDAGFTSSVVWQRADLAVIAADKRT